MQRPRNRTKLHHRVVIRIFKQTRPGSQSETVGANWSLQHCGHPGLSLRVIWRATWTRPQMSPCCVGGRAGWGGRSQKYPPPPPHPPSSVRNFELRKVISLKPGVSWNINIVVLCVSPASRSSAVLVRLRGSFNFFFSQRSLTIKQRAF